VGIWKAYHRRPRIVGQVANLQTGWEPVQDRLGTGPRCPTEPGITPASRRPTFQASGHFLVQYGAVRRRLQWPTDSGLRSNAPLGKEHYGFL